MDALTYTGTLASRPRPRAFGLLAAAFAVCYGAAAIGGAATGPRIDGWYRTIAKPVFNPPDWVFGPVWTVLFTMMALVLWQVARTPALTVQERSAKRTALVAFAVQLVLNVGWSVAFFGFTSIAAGMVVVVMLWAAILWSMLAARAVIGRPALWFLPYLAWVSFAALLNASILALN
jgi:tryptophan-rich sensory protein